MVLSLKNWFCSCAIYSMWLNEERQNKMAAEKGTCPVEGFYRRIGTHVRLKVYDLSTH